MFAAAYRNAGVNIGIDSVFVVAALNIKLFFLLKGNYSDTEIIYNVAVGN